MSLTAHLRAYLRDPKGVAALTPTSRGSVALIAGLAPVDEAGLVVEYGPGSGVLTRGLLARMPAGARLLAIEANAELAERLAAQDGDPRLTVVHDNAARIGEILAERGLGQPDCVVSGIPFFWLDPEQAQSIVAATHAALAPGGSFVTYQMFNLPRRRLHAHLRRTFAEVRTEPDLRNLPPQKIYLARK